MSKKIVILNSSGGAGKDTLVKFAKEILSEERVYKISSVDRTKEFAKLMGWNGIFKAERDRWFLANLKSLLTEYNNLPFIDMVTEMEHFINTYPNDSVMFIDVREPSEIEKLVKHFWYPVYTALVINNNVEDITSNHADSMVYNYFYDYVIDNSGSLDDLRDSAVSFLKDIKIKI